MKTIGIIDKADGSRRMRGYNLRVATTEINGTICMFNQKRVDRIKEALIDIKHLGNVDVYLIYGRKQRLLFSRGM